MAGRDDERHLVCADHDAFQRRVARTKSDYADLYLACEHFRWDATRHPAPDLDLDVRVARAVIGDNRQKIRDCVLVRADDYFPAMQALQLFDRFLRIAP